MWRPIRARISVWFCITLMSMASSGTVMAQEDNAKPSLLSKITPDTLPEEPATPDNISQRAKEGDGLLEQRYRFETSTQTNPFVITPHRPNYFFPVSFRPEPNQQSYSDTSTENASLDAVEFAFQLSIKFPVATSIVGKNSSLWFAYTQRAFWQAYNSEISAPFRDTNHEPEAFIIKRLDDQYRLGGLLPKNMIVGVNHQSNGQAGSVSRSWNRLYMEFVYESERTIYSIKPWYRLSETDVNDDNPNIERYLGYGELNVVHVLSDDYSLDLMLRNNLRSDNKGAVQLGFNFPMWGKIRGYVQYFNGYGNSLLDYNRNSETFGLGVMLTNWL